MLPQVGSLVRTTVGRGDCSTESTYVVVSYCRDCMLLRTTYPNPEDNRTIQRVIPWDDQWEIVGYAGPDHWRRRE